jgi:hypothetical protein
MRAVEDMANEGISGRRLAAQWSELWRFDAGIWPAATFQSAAAVTAPCTCGRRTRKHSGKSATHSHPDR